VDLDCNSGRACVSEQETGWSKAKGSGVLRRGIFSLGIAIAAFLSVVPGASARWAYVANSGEGTVSVIETIDNSVVGAIPVGKEPVGVAISPNAARAYVANKGDDSVTVIDTAKNTVVATVPVGKEPVGIAASPDGHRVYVSNFGADSVSAIDTGLNSVVGAIPVGKEPEGVAISPDGTRLLVAQRGGGVSIVDTGTNGIVGSVPDLLGPSQIAIGPRGGRAFVTNSAGSSVSAFNPVSGSLIGAPIVVGSKPAGIAIGPSGDLAYAASPPEGTLTPIDTSLDTPRGTIGGFPGATGVAVMPDGLRAYVTNGTGSTVSILDTTGSAAIGGISVGSKPAGIAILPDQGPQASFFVSPARRRAKKVLTFHASGSKDPDGQIANYAWDFGDGAHLEGPQPTRAHRYRQPGTYLVTLAATDNEGCSAVLVYTGQTASCNGSAAAIASSVITVGDTAGPILRLAGAKRQTLRPRVSVRARCPRESCSLRAHGVLVTSVESDGETVSRTSRLGQAQVLRPSRGWRTLRLRVPQGARRAARQALLLGGEAKAKIAVVARDEDGELRLERRKVELVLP
jgi:YVTN family beta-propeller protein